MTSTFCIISQTHTHTRARASFIFQRFLFVKLAIIPLTCNNSTNSTNIITHFLVSSTKHHASWLVITNYGSKSWSFLLGSQNTRLFWIWVSKTIGHQLVSPKNSRFAQNFNFIVIITTFLLKYYKFALTIGQIRQCGQSLMIVAKIIILAFSFWLHDLPIHYWYYFL